MSGETLRECPFCNREFGDDLIDVLYPTGTWWRDTDEVRMYFGHDAARHDGDGRCWLIVCAPAASGCGAEMHGDSREDVIARWNRRADRIERASGKDGEDAAIGRLVRSKLTSGNFIPVERCTVRASEVAEIDAAMSASKGAK